MPALHQFCSIVLVRTKYAGNLGSVARVMANFGVTDLRLVTPEAEVRSNEARALASHGEPVLESAGLYPTLAEAVSDCVWVGATSARLGGLYRKQNTVGCRDGMKHAAQMACSGRIALVFGPEDHGLTNDEVSLCHHLIHINAHPDYEVLNLAQAAAICLYEWFQATHDKPITQSHDLVKMDEHLRMLDHMEEALRAVHYIWGEKGPFVAHAIRHLLMRTNPDPFENKLLHGLARQLLWYVKHHPPGEKANMPPEEGEA
jgi:tRNA/rRNA methyltransferase